jgi:sulfotransferase family protein
MPSSSYTGHKLLFVVGAPRSGTTWLQRLLASHPDVRTGQESKLFTTYVSPQLAAWRREMQRQPRPGRPLTGRLHTGVSCYFTEQEFLKVLRAYTAELLRPMVGDLRSHEWFLEKTPTHAQCLDDIRLILPEARVVHLIRDGRDVVASLLAASHTWGTAWAPHTARRAARTWVANVQNARRAGAQFPADRYCEIRYEELSARTARVLRRVTDFLGLEWAETDLDAAIRANTADELRAGRGTDIRLGGEFQSEGRVTEPEGFVRRATVGAWRQDLSPGQRFVVSWVARDLLRELGYLPGSSEGTGALELGAQPDSRKTGRNLIRRRAGLT